VPKGALYIVSDSTFDPQRYELSPEILAVMERNWAETMGARFGLHSYDSVVEQLRVTS
jgi:hypothetical protein